MTSTSPEVVEEARLLFVEFARLRGILRRIKRRIDKLSGKDSVDHKPRKAIIEYDVFASGPSLEKALRENSYQDVCRSFCPDCGDSIISVSKMEIGETNE